MEINKPRKRGGEREGDLMGVREGEARKKGGQSKGGRKEKQEQPRGERRLQRDPGGGMRAVEHSEGPMVLSAEPGSAGSNFVNSTFTTQVILITAGARWAGNGNKKTVLF